MKVAIDKSCEKLIKNKKEFDFIYVFDDEPLQKLLDLKLHCVHKDKINGVDINLTNYKISAFKTAKITDKDWKKPVEKKDYRFAIIVPNYNNDHGQYKSKTYLQNCIESILNQTYKNFELIIVDDMSTDSSVETVEKYRNNEKYIDKIHLLTNKRKRYNGGSRNVGIEYALDYLDFDYFCFLDSDDWWINDEVLEHINRSLYNHEMMVLGCQILHKNGITMNQYNKFDTYEDIYFCINKVWCTAWSKVIRKDKIVYFCEDTLMEDRVWTYKQADNCNFKNIIHLNEICYVWNRLNTDNSVSMIRGKIWDASAYCHIGHQLQFLENMKHVEFKEKLKQRIKKCISDVNIGNYQQY